MESAASRAYQSGSAFFGNIRMSRLLCGSQVFCPALVLRGWKTFSIAAENRCSCRHRLLNLGCLQPLQCGLKLKPRATNWADSQPSPSTSAHGTPGQAGQALRSGAPWRNLIGTGRLAWIRPPDYHSCSNILGARIPLAELILGLTRECAP